MHIPTNWDEITLSQYLELTQLNPDDYESQIEFVIEKLAIITNSSSQDEYWEMMSYTELLKVLDSISFIQSSPPNKYKNVLLGKYYFIGYNQLSLGSFIDLEYYISDLSKFFSIVFRQKKQDEFDNDVFEPYSSYNLDKRSEILLDVPITHLFGLVNEYLKFRESIFEQYGGLFASSKNEDNFDEEFYKKHPELKQRIESDMKEDDSTKIEEQENKWGWERLLLHLANNDITKIDKILDMQLYFVFNIVGMRKELNL